MIILAKVTSLLIDPVPLESVEALHEFLSLVLKNEVSPFLHLIKVETLKESLKLEKPLVVNFGEHSVSLMMGEEDVIMANTSRFVHVGLLQELADL